MKEDEIASLKAQLVDLQSRLDAVEGCRPVVKPAPRPDEPAVRIEQIFEERRGDAPSAAELQKLLATVGRAFPDLAKALNADLTGLSFFRTPFAGHKISKGPRSRTNTFTPALGATTRRRGARRAGFGRANFVVPISACDLSHAETSHIFLATLAPDSCGSLVWSAMEALHPLRVPGAKCSTAAFGSRLPRALRIFD